MINIIIPVYKARDTLPLLIKSLEAQTKRMFMVTLVQDCDGEDYSDIINESHLNITLFHTEKNSGPGVARNIGLEHNSCEFVMFMDSDDMLMPRAIEAISREANIRNADIIKSPFIKENDYGIGITIIDGDNIIWNHGNIYKASYLLENNIWFPEERMNEDVGFNILATKLTNKKFMIEEPIYLWKFNKKSITRSENITPYSNYSKILYDSVSRVLERTEDAFSCNEIISMINGLYGISLIQEYYHQDYNKEYAIKFLNLEPVKKMYTTKNGLKKLISKIDIGAANANGNKIIFFEKSFRTWLRELTGYDIEEM